MYIILIAQYYYLLLLSRCYKFLFAILRKPNNLHNRIMSSLYSRRISTQKPDTLKTVSEENLRDIFKCFKKLISLRHIHLRILFFFSDALSRRISIFFSVDQNDSRISFIQTNNFLET